MIQFVTKAVHKCTFCERETESYDDIGYYVIDVYRKWTNAITKNGTQKHIVEKRCAVSAITNSVYIWQTSLLIGRKDNENNI